MKVLFINTNYPKVVDVIHGRIVSDNRKFVPLDLAYPAAVIEKEGHTVKIIDASIEDYSLDEIKEEAKDFRPDIVFINTSPMDRWQCPYINIEPCIKTVEAVKEAGFKTALIGPHCFEVNWLFSKSDSIDFVLRGEPDLICLDLVENLNELEKVDGLSYKRDKEIKHNKDRIPLLNLDKLPLPTYHLLPMTKYETYAVVSTRGCPFRCIFCFKKMYYGDMYRMRSVPDVLKEIRTLFSYGKKRIIFHDLEFALDKKRVIELCNEIINQNLKFEWCCFARTDRVDEELLGLMKKAGCISIEFGIESGSQKILDTIKKDIKKEDAKRILRIAKDLGLIKMHFALFALPGETYETINEHLDFIKELDLPYFSFGGNLAVPYPGTELNEIGRKEFNQEINWDNCKEFTGEIETNILNEIKGDSVIEISKLFFKKKYGKHYYLNPIFYFKNRRKLFSYLFKKI